MGRMEIDQVGQEVLQDNYTMTSWYEGNKTRNVHRGSARKIRM